MVSQTNAIKCKQKKLIYVHVFKGLLSNNFEEPAIYIFIYIKQCTKLKTDRARYTNYIVRVTFKLFTGKSISVSHMAILNEM